MDLRKLKTLIDLVAESGIAELEITEGEGKVKIVKSAAQTGAVGYAPATTVMMPTPATTPAAPAPAAANPVAQAETAAAAPPAGHRLASPMVGTFYRSSSPGGAPFVSIGDSVSEGQTLCVIEAMKLMNEIPADKAGVIKEILVENGQPVEFGQALFVIG
ncbi:MAG: acetyl-CoA carboxylase biotin carboxyl carrier protein [Betaproteobacteria bacterium]|nr:acetyl-CoA carboxylase biotin carboxyl carrier protein [Betaproteobacteria bacterium]